MNFCETSVWGFLWLHAELMEAGTARMGISQYRIGWHHRLHLLLLADQHLSHPQKMGALLRKGSNIEAKPVSCTGGVVITSKCMVHSVFKDHWRWSISVSLEEFFSIQPWSKQLWHIWQLLFGHCRGHYSVFFKKQKMFQNCWMISVAQIAVMWTMCFVVSQWHFVKCCLVALLL